MFIFRIIHVLLVFFFALYSVAGVANYYMVAIGISGLNFTVISLFSIVMLYVVGIILRVRLIKNINVFREVWVFIVPFLLVTFFSFFYSEYYDYALIKLFTLHINLTLAVLMSLTFTRTDVVKYSKLTIIFSLLLGLLYPYFYSGFFTVPIDINDDHVAVYLTSAALLAYAGALLISIKPFKKGNSLLLLLIYIEIAITGARGPLIFLIFAHFLYEIVVRRRLAFLFVFVPLVISLIFSAIQQDDGESFFSRMIYRFSLLFDGDSGARLEYWGVFVSEMNTLNRIFFGTGLGSFGVFKHGADTKGYPHNIFLGVMSDSGIIGLILFMFFILFYCRYFFKSKLLPLFIVPLVPLLELLKSSTYAEYRLFWIGLAIPLCFVANDIYKKENSVLGGNSFDK